LAGADAGAVRVLTADGLYLRLVGALGLPPEVLEQERYIPVDCGVCGEAARAHTAHNSTNLKACEERTAHDYFGKQCLRIVAVPLRYQGKMLGVYNLFMASDNPVPEDVSLLFHSISEHLGMALENARLKRENLRITLMNERQMMAAEVHDSLAQALSYMKMRMALLQDSIRECNEEKARKYSGDIGQALDDAYIQLRELLTQFRSRMDPLGLQQALKRQADSFHDRTGIALEFINHVVDLRLSVDQEAQVFFIVQEALANVRRHSKATQAWLTLEGTCDHYMITVDDNGRGAQGFFPIANRSGDSDELPYERDHFGLSIMRERARLVGGRVEMINLPERGFRVRLTFPAIGPSNPKAAV
ncbi:MAG: histidine kinase, partial [Rhodocyclaceae bacterium]|nr:histidine kinase [Rhodocyclaceae bacterium]